MDEEICFIGKGLDNLFALRIGEMADCGRLLAAARATKSVVYFNRGARCCDRDFAEGHASLDPVSVFSTS
jgi:hypothetical protein